MIGAYVSHQHEPKKKHVPKIQPTNKDFTKDSFSRSTAKNNGTSANHARNQNSKSGKAKTSRIADKTAKTEFRGAGIKRLKEEIFITAILTENRCGKNAVI